MMIVVADDFTGAAELAGIGLSHGMSVEMDIEQFGSRTDADLLVLATDTRSKEIAAAVKEVKSLAEGIKKFPSAHVYKKIDSVLRGHILEETQAMVQALGMKGAIVVPANPMLGRVIIDGHYYVHGEPLQHTSFSQDPEFDISSSSVAELLSRNGATPPFSIMKPQDFKGEGRIILGEASSLGDLDFWADKAGEGWLQVGAAGFFESLLKRAGRKVPDNGNGSKLVDKEGILYVCGSTFHGSRESVRLASEAGPFVCFMPEELFMESHNLQESFEEWIGQVTTTLANHGRAIVAVRQEVTAEKGKFNWIREQFSRLTAQVVDRSVIHELVIEGGSTASAVLYKLGSSRLKPFYQFERGVLRMKVEDRPGMFLTLKPGSYAWPESVWKF
ncbi:MAG: four-carbon acid sugar kinase family protein [Bacteroidales bacterium]